MKETKEEDGEREVEGLKWLVRRRNDEGRSEHHNSAKGRTWKRTTRREGRKEGKKDATTTRKKEGDKDEGGVFSRRKEGRKGQSQSGRVRRVNARNVFV
mmetsp:Transcript_18909/g.58254  ORF Transcript_18909/g.58254 Transcript_18909/m.58254 type:complete len:99 (-) Transcript_18909:1339-1635(-)